MIVTELLGDAGAYENITPGDTSTGISKSKYLPTSGKFAGRLAVGALLTAELNTMNITFDGTAPTATAGTDIGHNFAAGDSYVVRGTENVKNFRCIDAVSLSAGKVKVTLFF